jgi:hypothetical protein
MTTICCKIQSQLRDILGSDPRNWGQPHNTYHSPATTKNTAFIYYTTDILTINVPVFYMERGILIWMRGNTFRWPFEGVGPESRDFFGPLNGSERSWCHLGSKQSRLSGPTPSNGREMDFPASKSIHW